MQNYHRHTSYSNIYTADSAAVNEDYAKRAVELGHKVISSVEHGWQGYYFETYELAHKYNLKMVFGAEAYWVYDRHTKDKSNHHIIILAKTERGRQSINDILSEANISGYYYKPRVDLELLLSLPPNDVFITSACIAFHSKNDGLTGDDNIDNSIIKYYGENLNNLMDENIISILHDHFKENFMLEIQYHDTEEQKKWNRFLLRMSEKYGIDLIVGLDSHYIYEEDSQERDYVLAAKNIHYEDEDGWYMDYPDDETVMNRFLKQGVFTKEQVQKAMDNTDICLSFDDYDDVHIFSKDIKLPTLYPNLTKEEKDKKYSRLITSKFKEYMKNVPKERYDEYFEGVKKEVNTYKDTGMTDYPLIDYAIVNDAVEHGGLITDTGRGSAVGYFTNTLCGFSKVDRFTSAIKLYPERFISKTRILETHSLPDIDLNVGTPDIFEQAQINVLGEDHVAPMIAFGTFKKKSSFKLYARAQKLDFDIANTISEQIGKYEEAMKYADDDEKDEIDLYDYVDKKYESYINASEKYWGIISDKKKAPSAYLLYQGNIRKEIGLIKCKSESTKKEYITCVIDGAIAENYKYLKNDILKVDVVLLIDKIFKRIGIEHFSVNKLLELVETDQKVWNLYANGYTIGLNQCEKESTTKKCMKYKPSNVSELSAFIAAIRPGFKSMYSKFESREQFDYGIPAFDKIIQTKQFPYSFIMYQEQTMNTLNYAGFPLDECYGIIKAIAKKHPEKVKPLKSKFIDGFRERIIADEGIEESKAQEMSEKVWQIINDSCGYGFNSAHAFCMALDSLYNAWQKANYPYEFYEVMLQHYSDKGNKDKVALIKEEMLRAYDIKEGKYSFGADNRTFKADKENKVIYSSLLGIKGLSQKCADDLYKLSQKESFDNFYDLFKAMKKIKSVNSGKVNVLVKIGYFDNFGKIGKIQKFLSITDDLYERSQFGKSDIKAEYLPYIMKYSEETEKQYRNFNYDAALYDIWNDLEDSDISLNEKLQNELELLGYVQTTVDNIPPEYAFVKEYECKFKNPKLTLYRLCNGDIEVVKVKRPKYDENPIHQGDIIKTIEASNEGRWYKDKDGEWQQDRNDEETILKKWSFVR